MPHDLETLLEMHPFRRISRSIVEMAFLTGVVIRVLHALFSAHGSRLDWYVFAGRFILIPVIALAMVSIHLANYPVRQWLWRAPVFALIEAATGAVTSLVLITLGRERWGTAPATFSDWPSMAGGIMLWHVTVICLFALILGAVVQWVRRYEFAAERRHHHEHAHEPTHEHAQEPPEGVPPTR